MVDVAAAVILRSIQIRVESSLYNPGLPTIISNSCGKINLSIYVEEKFKKFTKFLAPSPKQFYVKTILVNSKIQKMLFLCSF